MTEIAYRELRPLVQIVQVWDEHKCIRGLLSLKTKDEFIEILQEEFPDSPEVAEWAMLIVKINVPNLSHSLPGINKKLKHPVSNIERTLFDIIISLNDEHKWTREAIADWIETLEEVPTFK